MNKWIFDLNESLVQLQASYQLMTGVEVVVTCVILLGLLGLLCLILTLVTKIHFNNRLEKKTKVKREKFQDYLSYVISTHIEGDFMHDFNDIDPIYLETEDLQDNFYRQIFLVELKSIHSVLEGKERETLRDLYLGFGFASEVSEKIFSRNWEKRIEAINEIGDFNLHQFYPILVSCLKDENKYVRKAAFLKYASLKTNPIDALNYIEGKINGWEKQIILENLRKRSNELIPLFQNFKEKYPLHSEFLDELSDIFGQESKKGILLLMESKKA